MALPDFLIVGAMKCGTSTLAAQLALQDGLFMTDPKEPNFFSDDDVHARGRAWYEALFDAAAPGDLKGEASTHYTKLPTHPETLPRMRALLDAPRLVYMIRDPVERAVSHYIHEWSQGLIGSDFARAVADHSELVDYGRYAYQIAPYIEAYGRDSICLTSLERLTAAPEEELARICAFIGHEGPVRWHDDLGAQNVSAERVRRLPLHGLIVDNPVATALRRTLIPKSWRTRVRQARTMKTRPEVPPALRARLEAVFAEDRARLAELFPGHGALDDAYGVARDAG